MLALMLLGLPIAAVMAFVGIVGGTLGILIPPSVNLLIHGSLSETAIGQLFVAGIVPGLLLTGCFML